jgi:hypothetical protein
MGRHSAPEADLEDALEIAEAAEPVAEVADGPGGRHSRTVEEPGDGAGGADAAVETGEADPAVETAATEPAAAPSAVSGTRADLHLLRTSRALRVRCAAAVIAPFAVFTIVLVLLGRTDVYLIWIWIPTVLAGVLVGALLDAAHRRLSAPPPDRP